MYIELKKLCDTNGVSLVVVSKYQPLEKIAKIYDLGQRSFAENRVQELLERKEALPKDIQWHLIGHLQTNKVKYVIPFVYLIHSVDSERLLAEIEKQSAQMGKRTDVLIQVKIAKEDEKYGFDYSEIVNFFNRQSDLSYHHIRIRGLMGMATFTSDEKQISEEFEKLSSLFDMIKLKREDLTDFNLLSMGMSSDYLIAIAKGSNVIRVGSAIFDALND
jgi:pyridoxal phosphate enzyme (YggS family)